MLAIGGLALPQKEASPEDTQKLFEELGKQYVIKKEAITYLVKVVGCADLHDSTFSQMPRTLGSW